MLEKVCTNTTATHRVRPGENSEIKLGICPTGIKKKKLNIIFSQMEQIFKQSLICLIFFFFLILNLWVPSLVCLAAECIIERGF